MGGGGDGGGGLGGGFGGLGGGLGGGGGEGAGKDGANVYTSSWQKASTPEVGIVTAT